MFLKRQLGEKIYHDFGPLVTARVKFRWLYSLAISNSRMLDPVFSRDEIIRKVWVLPKCESSYLTFRAKALWQYSNLSDYFTSISTLPTQHSIFILYRWLVIPLQPSSVIYFSLFETISYSWIRRIRFILRQIKFTFGSWTLGSRCLHATCQPNKLRGLSMTYFFRCYFYFIFSFPYFYGKRSDYIERA